MQARFSSLAVPAAFLFALLIVNAPSAHAAPTIYLSFDASRTQIEPGEAIRLSWASSGARKCYGSGDGTGWWRGDKPLQGARDYRIDESLTYTLTCSNAGGETSQSVTIAVAEPEPEPVAEAGPGLELTVDREQIEAGQQIRLRWASVDAARCHGSGEGTGWWQGSKPLKGARDYRPEEALTYTLTCSNAKGETSRSVSVAMAAQPEPAPEPAPVPEPEPLPEPEPELPVVVGPDIQFSVDSTSIQAGETVRLRWSAPEANRCQGSGEGTGWWDGRKPTSGIRDYQPESSVIYTLACRNGEGETVQQIAVAVAQRAPVPEPEPEPEEEVPAAEPTVALVANPTVIGTGESTTLRWNSTHASSCSANGAWSGQRAPNGEIKVGPLQNKATFSLTCAGDGGNAMAMISVAVNDSIKLTWQAPSRNLDGSAIDDLAGYRIYYGQQSGEYSDSILIQQPGARGHALTLPSGSYFFAMTALDAEGNESPYSNEIAQDVL